MRTPLVIPPNPTTPEQYAKKLGISRKRFLELKAITDRVLAENASRFQGSSKDSDPFGGKVSVGVKKPKSPS